jgi:hypothetical protein
MSLSRAVILLVGLWSSTPTLADSQAEHRVTLVCRLTFDTGPPTTSNVKVVLDYQARTVNGHSAEIAAGYASTKWAELQGTESTDYQIYVNRYTWAGRASITRSGVTRPITVVGTGPCARLLSEGTWVSHPQRGRSSKMPEI